MSGSWLVPWHTGPGPTLLCLPAAGSGCGQFREWQEVFGNEATVVGVQLPGRETRFTDPPAESVAEAVRAIVTELVTLAFREQPIVVFGHSFGGLLGYEVTCLLQDEYDWIADALVVAASRPPHLSGKAKGSMGEGTVDDGFAPLMRNNDMDEDIRELMLDLLRQDARLSATYVDSGGTQVRSPVHAWGGELDEIVSSDQLDGWRAYAAGPFERRQFPGGHGFCTGRAELVLSALRTLIIRENR